MAKSKSGGTRSYIRGKIGADVYSIGKDGKGAKQQVVRSLAEVVSNPQTEAQMRGRMIMSTVMQAVSALSPIIDHSFDNVPNGQPAISEFISRNYALIKADVAAHPSSSNTFGLNKYQEKGAKGGVYVIADGSVVKPADLLDDSSATGISVMISLTNDTLTVGGMKAALGLAGGDYITIVAIKNDGSLGYCRAYITDSLADDTAITSENAASLFTLDQNLNVTVSLSSTYVMFESTTVCKADGIILSKKVESAWKHSTSTMKLLGTNPDFAASVALPTYPTGASRFLNGGDI